MTIQAVFFDVGGVLGTNAWDHEQRAAVLARFGLDRPAFEERHKEAMTALETGIMTFDRYLEATVFYEPRSFTREAFVAAIHAESEPWADSIAVARELRGGGRVHLATLNNEGEALNTYRIDKFGLAPIFHAFLSSCWLGMRKPAPQIYQRALSIMAVRPDQAVFVDDRGENIDAAAALGIRAILYADARSLRREFAALGLF